MALDAFSMNSPNFKLLYYKIVHLNEFEKREDHSISILLSGLKTKAAPMHPYDFLPIFR